MVMTHWQTWFGTVKAKQYSRVKEHPARAVFGQSENRRQLPTEQSAPEGVEGTIKSGQRPCGAGETTSVHKAGAEVTWFGSHPLIRDPDSAVI